MELPCIDCITFAVCKDTVPMRHSGTALGGHIESTLIKKCSLLHDFIYNDNYNSGSAMIEVKKYFSKKMNQGGPI
jgi:hypothetical protein